MGMDEEKYNERMKQIEADYDKAKKALYIEYAMSHVKFKKGDIIKDNAKTILIDNITTSKFIGLPEPVYHGVELKKDLTPKKSGERNAIYGNRSVDLLKEGVTPV